MARVAAFAASPAGHAYALICDRYNLDPAAGFADDVVAFNLRAALMGQAAPANPNAATEEAWAAAAHG